MRTRFPNIEIPTRICKIRSVQTITFIDGQRAQTFFLSFCCHKLNTKILIKRTNFYHSPGLLILIFCFLTMFYQDLRAEFEIRSTKKS